MSKRKTIQEIREKKKNGKKITMLTAYDYPLASLIDQAGIDIILVGDSVANVVLGLESTRQVGIEAMIHHAKAVNRAVQSALLVGDMPFESLQKDMSGIVEDAQRFVEEAGCNAVKLEWFGQCLEATQRIIEKGISVMGHVGLTPQTAEYFKVQGKDAQSALRILEHAQAMEKRGCFSIVLECIPDKIADIITKKLSIPTIGIGAGIHCDGQVLVSHDLLGLFDRFKPKFVKQFGNLTPEINKSILRFKDAVERAEFPDQEHSYTIDQKEVEKLDLP